MILYNFFQKTLIIVSLFIGSLMFGDANLPPYLNLHPKVQNSVVIVNPLEVVKVKYATQLHDQRDLQEPDNIYAQYCKENRKVLRGQDQKHYSEHNKLTFVCSVNLLMKYMAQEAAACVFSRLGVSARDEQQDKELLKSFYAVTGFRLQHRCIYAMMLNADLQIIFGVIPTKSAVKENPEHYVRSIFDTVAKIPVQDLKQGVQFHIRGYDIKVSLRPSQFAEDVRNLLPVETEAQEESKGSKDL